MVQKRGERILDLHCAGHTYREIASITGAAKSVISYWVTRKGAMTKRERARLRELRRQRVRTVARKGSEAAQRMWHKARQAVRAEARREFRRYARDPFFTFGLGLYAGEGRKEHDVAMTNLDCRLLGMFATWCTRFLGVRSFNGSMHTHEADRYVEFQRDVGRQVRVPIAWSPRPVRPLAKPGAYERPYGAVRLRVRGCRLGIVRVQAWLDCLKDSRWRSSRGKTPGCGPGNAGSTPARHPNHGA
jgi:hypothetical protein